MVRDRISRGNVTPAPEIALQTMADEVNEKLKKK